MRACSISSCLRGFGSELLALHCTARVLLLHHGLSSLRSLAPPSGEHEPYHVVRPPIPRSTHEIQRNIQRNRQVPARVNFDCVKKYWPACSSHRNACASQTSPWPDWPPRSTGFSVVRSTPWFSPSLGWCVITDRLGE